MIILVPNTAHCIKFAPHVVKGDIIGVDLNRHGRSIRQAGLAIQIDSFALNHTVHVKNHCEISMRFLNHHNLWQYIVRTV